MLLQIPRILSYIYNKQFTILIIQYKSTPNLLYMNFYPIWYIYIYNIYIYIYNIYIYIEENIEKSLWFVHGEVLTGLEHNYIAPKGKIYALDT